MHHLIDECGIGIVHRHSSHHCQGIENHKGKGSKPYRDDLGRIWMIHAAEQGDSECLVVKKLETYPTRTESFQVRWLDENESDGE